MKINYTLAKENPTDVLQEVIGQIFTQVLEHGYVYPCSEEGMAAVLQFGVYVNR